MNGPGEVVMSGAVTVAYSHNCYLFVGWKYCNIDSLYVVCCGIIIILLLAFLPQQ